MQPMEIILSTFWKIFFALIQLLATGENNTFIDYKFCEVQSVTVELHFLNTSIHQGWLSKYPVAPMAKDLKYFEN